MADLREQTNPTAPSAADSTGGATPSRVPTLEDLLASLRLRASACEPPVGVGSFDLLYASNREVVVWYSPARPEHHPGEVAIPTERLAAAWSALARGEALDEAALERIGEGAALSRWLLAVLAQVPGVRVRLEPSLALEWAPQELRRSDAAPATADVEAPSRRRRKRVT